LEKQDNLPVDLTHRQKAFLDKLQDLYRDIPKPVHYSVIAKKLGLCASSVYDMLRVLEKKGVVSSEYKLPKSANGPGRSNIMFTPIVKKIEKLTQNNSDARDSREWKKVKDGILSSLQGCAACDYKKLFSGMFEKASHIQSPLPRAAQILAGLLVSLKESKYEFSEQSTVGTMLKSPASKVGMSTTAGVIMGLSVAGKKDGSLLGNYRDYLNKYMASLQNISDENLQVLHEFALDVWNILGAAPAY